MRWSRPVFLRSAVEREMDAELRFHYGRMVEDFERRGVAPEEARRRTRLEFGGLGQLKDDSREARLAGRIEGLWRGLRMAWKALAKSPGFTAVAVVTMALGIGVNTVMFSLMDHLLLRNLPVRDPQRLVVFHGNFTTPGMYRSNGRGLSFSWPKYTQFRDESTVFSGVAARFAAATMRECFRARMRTTAPVCSGARPGRGRPRGTSRRTRNGRHLRRCWSRFPAPQFATLSGRRGRKAFALAVDPQNPRNEVGSRD